MSPWTLIHSPKILNSLSNNSSQNIHEDKIQYTLPKDFPKVQIFRLHRLHYSDFPQYTILALAEQITNLNYISNSQEGQADRGLLALLISSRSFLSLPHSHSLSFVLCLVLTKSSFAISKQIRKSHKRQRTIMESFFYQMVTVHITQIRNVCPVKERTQWLPVEKH